MMISARVLAAIAGLLAAAPALAQQVTLTSDVKVERATTDANGKATVTLEEPRAVTPGDVVRFTLSYANTTAKPATDFVVTNPLPPAIELVMAEDGALHSVDGTTFAPLAQLKVAAADGTARAATAADVRFLRWAFKQPIAPGAKGALHYRGRVK